MGRRSLRKTPDQLALAEAVRCLRRRQRVTQEMVAYDAGVSSRFVSDVECAHLNPSWGRLLAIVRALGSSMDEFGEIFERERAALPPADHGIAYCPSPEASAHTIRARVEYRRRVEATRAKGRMQSWI